MPPTVRLQLRTLSQPLPGRAEGAACLPLLMARNSARAAATPGAVASCASAILRTGSPAIPIAMTTGNIESQKLVARPHELIPPYQAKTGLAGGPGGSSRGPLIFATQ